MDISHVEIKNVEGFKGYTEISIFGLMQTGLYIMVKCS
jgi:hypothetical protein